MSSPIVVTFQPSKPARRDQHREIGLAAGARKRRGNVGLLARGRGHAEDQHVLGQPALVAAHDRGDAQREALLAEQRVAAVARAVATRSRAFSGKCTMYLCSRLHGHATSFCAGRERRADRMHAGHEVAVGPEHVEHRASHARHDPHVDDDVGESEISTPMCEMWRADRAHRERHDVHRAPAHAAVEEAVGSSRASRPVRPSCWSGRRPPLARSR